MKKLVLIVGSALFAIPIYAQNNSVNTTSRRINTEFISPENRDKPERAEGSPYITEEFVPAKVNGSDKLFAIRYNGSKDLMEVKGDDDKTLLINKYKDYVIKLTDGSNKVYQTVSYENGTRGFALSVWIDEGKNGLFIRESVKYSPEKIAQSSYDRDQPPKFSRQKDAFYMRIGEKGNLVQLPSNKKKFYAAFGNKQKEIQAFVKKEKLKISKKEDLIKIMLFYFS